jgi:DNA-binding CsgD family transcriptional regulator
VGPFREGDAKALLEVVSAIEYDAPTDAFGPEPFIILAELLGATTVGYIVTDHAARRIVVDVCVDCEPFPGRCSEIEDLLWTLIGDIESHAAAVQEPGVHLLEDLIPRRAFRRTPFFNEYCQAAQTEPLGFLALRPRAPGVSRRITFGGPFGAVRPFRSKERRALELLAPHFAKPVLAAEARRQRRAALGLTARELEVLALVADGCSNAEVAGALWLSPLTVRKHLENVFAKLGVHTRAEAVALVAPLDRPGGDRTFQHIVRLHDPVDPYAPVRGPGTA